MRIRYRFLMIMAVLFVFTSNSFAQWEPIKFEWENGIQDVFVENNYLFVITTDYINYDLFLSTDNGDNFINISKNLPDSVSSAQIDDIAYHKGNIYLVIDKELFKTPDLGTTWYGVGTSYSESGVPYSIRAGVISIESDGEKLYAGTTGNSGALLVSEDDGEQWEYINEINFPYREIDQIEVTDSYIYYKVNNSVIYRSDYTMGDWINILSDSSIRDFSTNSSGDSLLVRKSGDSLLVSTDAGENFDASEVISGPSIYSSTYANGTFFVNFVPYQFNPIDTEGGLFYSNSSTNHEWMSLSDEQYLKWSEDMKANDKYLFIQYGDSMITRTALSNFGITTDIDTDDKIDLNYHLAQNYPNPFNPTTKINYSIPKQSNVTIKVYDILGKEVSTLVNIEKPAGTYQVNFNGGNLSSGIYFYTLKTADFLQTKKMLLIK